ncbi:hypothetical protein HC725_02990 [Vibrio sp. S17_S38]|uniref:hypothetical protein n=1 Tax=Vibrio sp. S17_S38 TaxID=2720229 RepID=UPI001680FE1A|nr:hypothetical protein [Vibrio sp. S17_S38]MBD1572249.1 hypothetical protein [Vibrio sp. S17_S38]
MNKLFIVFAVFIFSGCSSTAVKNLGESSLYNNHYHLERHFDAPNSSKANEIKYYLANIGDGTIEIPPTHMWYANRKNQAIDNDGYFENIFLYEKINGEYKKYDNLLAVKDGRDVLVPIYHCAEVNWCQLYIPPISRGAYKQYQSGKIEPFDKDGLFYFISHGLYIKHDDLYKLK